MRDWSQQKHNSDVTGTTGTTGTKTSSRWIRTKEWIKRTGAGFGIVAILSPAATPAQQTSQQTQQQPPPHWISYAQLASNQFAAWLSDPADDAVVRLHGWMQERLLKEGQPLPPPLVTRVWVAPSGKVERLEFASLGNAQADKDLRALLTAQPLSESPPPDMRQPMVLQLSLDFPQK